MKVAVYVTLGELRRILESETIRDLGNDVETAVWGELV